jgi:hypothetical protein
VPSKLAAPMQETTLLFTYFSRTCRILFIGLKDGNQDVESIAMADGIKLHNHKLIIIFLYVFIYNLSQKKITANVAQCNEVFYE